MTERNHVQTVILVANRFVPVAAMVFLCFIKPMISQSAVLVVQAGHTDRVVSAAFSDDGKLLATAGEMRNIKIWETSTGKLLKSLDASTLHTEDDEFWPVSFKFAFSRNSRYLAVDYGIEDNTVIWNIATGKSVSTDCTRSEALAFAEDNVTLVAAGWDTSAGRGVGKERFRVCSVLTGRQVGPKQPKSAYWKLFPPGKKMHTQISEDGLEITLTLMATGEQVFAERQTEPLRSFQSGPWNNVVPESRVISGNGRRVALFGDEGSINIFQIRPKKLLPELPKSETVPGQCSFSYDGASLACSFFDGSLRVWRETTGTFTVLVPGNPIPPPPDKDAAPSDRDFFEPSIDIDVFAAFAPGSSVVAIGSKSHCPRFVDIADPEKPVAEEAASAAIRSLKFILNDQAVAFSRSGAFGIFRFSGERMPLGSVFYRFGYSQSFAEHVFYGPERKSLIINRNEGRSALWAFEPLQEVASLPEIEKVMFDPDNKFFIARTGSDNSRYFYWDIAAGKELWSLEPSESKDPAFSNSPDIILTKERRLFLGPQEVDLNTGVRIRSVDSSAIKDIYATSKLSIDDLVPNSDLTIFDGSRMIGICSSRFENSKTKQSFDVAICGISLSSDRKKILGRTEDGRIKIVDLAGNDIVTIIPRGESDWVVVTPDGRFDTNMSLDNIYGMHWITSDDPLTPRPLEVFMRQYYEPGLLHRVIRCNQTNNCDKEFRPLPSITKINRIRPRLRLRQTVSAGEIEK